MKSRRSRSPGWRRSPCCSPSWLCGGSGAGLSEDHPDVVRVVGDEGHPPLVVLLEAAGDVLLAEGDVAVGGLRRGDVEDQGRLDEGSLAGETLVAVAGVLARRGTQHLQQGRAGLEDRAPLVLA